MKKLFLLDAYALIYRSYYAFIRNPRFTSNGLNTSAILGFTNSLLEVLEKQNPSHIAVVFDPKGKTFRHEEFKEYKAQRPPMPEEIRDSIPYIQKIIEGFNIPCLSVDNYEADDVIGTLAHQAADEGFEVYMMTPDKDYAQLVTKNIFMFKPKRGGRKEEEVWGVDEVRESFGIENPLQVIDILGLMGDASDNIPGCPGIGPKTAQKLIEKYGSIENLLDNVEDLKGKQKQNLIEYADQVRMSKMLVTIKLDVPIKLDAKSLEHEEPNFEALQEIFRELEFATLSKRIFNKNTNNIDSKNKPTDKTKADSSQQTSLFDDGNFGYTEEKVSQSLPIQRYFLIDTAERRQDLRAEMCLVERYSIRMITQKDSYDCLGFAVSLKEDEAFYVPLSDKAELQEFHHIFGDENLTMIAHDCKQVLLTLFWNGVEVKNKLWDTLLAHYVLQPELKHDFDYVVHQLLNYMPKRFEDLLGKGRDKKSAKNLSLETLHQFACEEASLTLRVQHLLQPTLEERKVLDLFHNIEIPLVWVLAQLEYNGATIDTELLSDYKKKLEEELNEIEAEIKEMADEPDLNVASPKQLGEVLFGKMQLNSKAKKTASGQYSTSEKVLVKLRDKHPIINKILAYRSLSKLISTYVEALPHYISEKTGRIHTTFNQAETSTGRLSSTNPNLQNIPIRTEQGRYIRKAFIPSDDEHIFVSADYSQIELRIMAHLSEDEEMLAAFNRNEDIHTATAAKVFKVKLEEVTPEMRRQAKTANFGIIYGISAWGLAERLDISRTDGKQLIDGYFKTYPKVKEFMDEAVHKARKRGYVETIMQRRRYLKDINSNNAIVRGVAERNAINAPIQGSAADIIKLAMIRIHKMMKEEGLKSEMIIQVHDELNFNCLRTELEELKRIIKIGMEEAVKLSVPLTAEIGVGDNWLEAH
ncbi:DNA polymerase I [Balneicella halophila]|uniref:DNA polymerase I n=1 Tax=Balneicella halophila TaxID=1537566 RepID=A0A7L4UQA0_BALHA|nr:DNA polymerase I [Balneicella halophila]PVX51955.1 DNA polymerase I [Balneicella halophila]